MDCFAIEKWILRADCLQQPDIDSTSTTKVSNHSPILEHTHTQRAFFGIHTFVYPEHTKLTPCISLEHRISHITMTHPPSNSHQLSSFKNLLVYYDSNSTNIHRNLMELEYWVPKLTRTCLLAAKSHAAENAEFLLEMHYISRSWDDNATVLQQIDDLVQKWKQLYPYASNVPFQNETPSEMVKREMRRFILEEYLPGIGMSLLDAIHGEDLDAPQSLSSQSSTLTTLHQFAKYLVAISCVNHSDWDDVGSLQVYLGILPLIVMNMEKGADVSNGSTQKGIPGQIVTGGRVLPPQAPALPAAPNHSSIQGARSSLEKNLNLRQPPPPSFSSKSQSSTSSNSSVWPSWSYNSSSSSTSYRNHLDSDDTISLDNAMFYLGRKPLRRYRLMFDDMIRKWWGKYEFLEDSHDYIQCLFPIRERGMSSQQPLTKYEAQLFQQTPEMQHRLIQSYELMLDFYGLRLVDRRTGEVERTEQWKDRFENLNDYSHNYLRITRILKCLGICGLEYLKKPFLKHMFTEFILENQLPNIRQSLVRFWLPTLRHEADLIEVEELVKELSGKRISRRDFDKACKEDNWANTFYPIDASQWPKGKTFYDRDEDDPKKGDDIFDSSYRFERKWSNSNSGMGGSDTYSGGYGSRWTSIGGRHGGWFW